MSSLVFGCPNCQQPFQVAAQQAGQVVQCPSCAQTVEIPADAFAATPAPQPPPAQDPQAFGCPSCGGQFGVTPDMDGQQVACPHCQAPTTIQLTAPTQSTQPTVSPVSADLQEESPLIKTNLPVSRKRRKNLKKLAKSKGPARIDQDLFAPGSKKEQPTSTPVPPAPIQPGPANTASPSPAPPTSVPTTTASSTPAQSPPIDTTTPSKTGASSLSPLVPQLRPADPGIKAKTETSSADQPSTPLDSTSPTTKEASKSAASDQDEKIAVDEPKPDQRPSIAHLLPPTFDVLDPARIGVGSGNEKFKVLLPDGQGGTAQIDNRVLRIKHGEEQVSLVSMTPEQRAKQRLIQNIIAILIGIAVMALAFTILM